MHQPFCGLDFGTSNSTLSTIRDGKAFLIPLEKGKLTLPTALFFAFHDPDVFFGREAMNEYVEGEFGRLMRSIKSVLGTPLMQEKTRVGAKEYGFDDIIALFLSEMKKRAEKQVDQDFSQVVLGRPVYFVDGDAGADKEAEMFLANAAKQAGFKDVLFQYEPIAAALDYESQVLKEELALIVDLGGGTSDFSIVRISPEAAKKQNRAEDILASGGVHIGGTDFDKHLSMATVMPELGSKTVYEDDPTVPMPLLNYFDLATWHRIHFLYDKETVNAIRTLARRMLDREKVNRFVTVLEKKEGHRLALEVENAKIALTETAETALNLSFVEDKLQIIASRSQFDESISADVEGIQKALKETLKTAGVQRADITKIFMTGGSTAIPLVRHTITDMFKDIDLVEGDRFGSVGTGLAVEAQRQFG